MQLDINASIASSLSALVGSIQAPAVQLPKFDGNPMDYTPFMASFDDNVVRFVGDASGRLSLLIQHCRGNAQKLIEGCRHLAPPSHAYQRARDMLKEEFGQRLDIVDAYIKHLTKPYPTLQELAVELRGCVEALSGLGALQEAGHRTHLDRIAERFPEHLHRKWRKVTLRARQEGATPTLQQMARVVGDYVEEMREDRRHGRTSSRQDFAQRVARQREEPRGARRPRDVQRPQQRERSPLRRHNTARCYATSTTSAPHCRRCDTHHYLTDCPAFANMDHERKREETARARACFRCLKPGHFARDCEKTCARCQQQHHELLHRDEAPAPGNAAPTTQKEKTWPPKDKRPPRSFKPPRRS